MVAYYGPKPCASDDECVKENGAGWYCDKGNAFVDPCGGATTWPMCKQGQVDVPDVPPTDVAVDCGMMVAYGPPPCESDADCAQWYGEGFYCDKANADPCWGPSCQPIPGDVIDNGPDVPPDCANIPVVMYGPSFIGCKSDADCKDMGADWYCDTSDPCMPYCQQMPADVIDVGPDTPIDCGGGNIALYGVQATCQNDKDCVSIYGEGWYCAPAQDPCSMPACLPTPEDVIDNGPDTPLDCGGGIAPLYGVQVACTTDEECVKKLGVGAYCDTSDPCASPSCKLPLP